MKGGKNELTIENISNTNVHYQSKTPSPVSSITQLESGIVALGLSSGTIYFYSQLNLSTPYSSLKIDSFPINTILQQQDDQLMCCSGSFIYMIFENNLKKYDFNKKEKLTSQNIYGKIHKFLLLPDETIITGDNKYISSFRRKGKKLNLIKQIKVNSPVIDLLLVQNNQILAAAPKKKTLIFVDVDKFVQNYEINNIKFSNDIKMNNIICKLQKDLLAIGGCTGMAYLVNLKNRQFVANVNLRYKNETITTMFKMSNGDLLCGTCFVFKDPETQKEYINSNLAQYRYENKVFQEIYRKSDAHENIIKKICEIVNHKGISEIGTISFDSTFKVWD